MGLLDNLNILFLANFYRKIEALFALALNSQTRLMFKNFRPIC